jgi:tetratricopeptide (TPR) repeat protein
MSHAPISRLTSDVHLKRALNFVQEVENATDKFRQSAIDHDSQLQQDKPFLEGMISTIRGSRDLAQQKARLFNDLQLAEQELGRAIALDGSAEIETEHGKLNAVQLRSWIVCMKGQVEMIWGNPDTAIQLFNQCIQTWEFADAHYMLGMVYESKYMPTPALQHFERCLELDPSGELSVSALREANAMRNYKKRFRGSWSTFLVLLLCFPAALVYYFVKRK